MKYRGITYIKLNRMKFNIIQSIFIILLSINSVNAQTYYGKEDFGKFEFVNDSICTISFVNKSMYNLIDTCKYTRNNDTIYLFSSTIRPLEITVNKEEQKINSGYPILLKQYIKNKEGYKLIFEYCYGIYDTINNIAVFNNVYIKKGYINVIKDGSYYYRFEWNYGDAKHFTIKDTRFSSAISSFFDKFPLLIRGNRLIPLDKENNFQCWVDNGFYFPTMKKSKKEKKYKTIGYWSIGLRGLPSGFDIK